MGIKSHLEANFDFEIVDEFLDHYSLMVDSMEVMITDLSKLDMREKSVNELFRVFHTIKSSSAFLGLQTISKLSAFVEDALDVLRKTDRPISDEVINWLLLISDMFSQWNDDFKNDNELSKIKFFLLKIPDLDK
ncbi:MAG: Hpt domain-containing protein [Campylobacterales bacterium]